jgi:hypothetical protein
MRAMLGESPLGAKSPARNLEGTVTQHNQKSNVDMTSGYGFNLYSPMLTRLNLTTLSEACGLILLSTISGRKHIYA